MRLNIYIISLLLISCSTPTIKLSPEHNGVDPKLQTIVNNYKTLALKHNIKFTKEVTVGFKDISESNVVGLCTYGLGFREVDVDINYWNNSNYLQKHALLYHELTHCYCGRGHDYKIKKNYPDSLLERIKIALQWVKNGGDRPGYWSDGCPITLMYPVMPAVDCIDVHRAEYIQEMFDRCEPY